MNNLNLPRVAKAFPVFCQKVLPLTFDNSLSYLEFLAHVNAKLNETIEALNNYGAYMEQFYQIINENFEQLKTEIENSFAEYKTEIEQALNELEQELIEDINNINSRVDNIVLDIQNINNDIFNINGDITNINENITNIENTIETLETGAGDVSVNAEIETNESLYTVLYTQSPCDVYYKNANSDIWHELTTDTTINTWLALLDPSDILNRDIMFMFHAYIDFNAFKFPKGSIFTSTATTSENSYVTLYSRDSIPHADFNAGLTLITNGNITTENSTDTAILTVTNSDSNINCLAISNNFVNAWVSAITPFTITAPAIFGRLYKNGDFQNVTPKIKIDDTLHYTGDTLGAVSPFVRLTQAEWELITPDPDTLYFVTAVNGDINMYYGNMCMAAGYAVGNVTGSMQTAGSTIVGDFEVLED